MITFETGTLSEEWETLKVRNQLLAAIVEAGATYAEREHEWRDFRATCIYRPPEEDGAAMGRHGVHCQWRAVDVGARGVDPATVADVSRHVNELYAYDPTRPAMVVAYSAPHGTGPHIHFQTHPNTRPKEGA